MAITMIETLLFRQPNILFTTMVDITPTKITTHIALKLGYIFDQNTNTFVKLNPNINIAELKNSTGGRN